MGRRVRETATWPTTTTRPRRAPRLRPRRLRRHRPRWVGIGGVDQISDWPAPNASPVNAATNVGALVLSPRAGQGTQVRSALLITAGKKIKGEKPNLPAGDFDGVVPFKSYTTALRPAAATVGENAQIWDSTLKILIWSNGTAWINGAGTVV